MRPSNPNNNTTSNPLSKQYVLFFALALLAGPGYAAADVITEADILLSVEQHHPLLIAAEQKIKSRTGEVLSKQGVFDPVLGAEIFETSFGDYPKSFAEIKLTQPTRFWGLELMGGYQRAVGQFGSYEGTETGQGGEFNIGASLPLLKGRATDERRVGVSNAILNREIAMAEFRVKKQAVMQKALETFWTWSAAIEVLNITDRLVILSQDRVKQIRTRIELGELPQIDSVDNERILLKRQGQLVKATQVVKKNALALSLYLRDSNGLPRSIDVKADKPSSSESVFSLPVYEELIRLANKNRPELSVLNETISIKKNERKLAANKVLPELNLIGKYERDVPDTFRTREDMLKIGLTLKMPLRLREARGKRFALERKIEGLANEKQWLKEQIKNQVKEWTIELKASESILAFATKEKEYALQVQNAEKERFALGEVQLLNVILREKAAADAQINFVKARLALHKTHARSWTVFGRSSASLNTQ